jgi:hypothetical protein
MSPFTRLAALFLPLAAACGGELAPDPSQSASPAPPAPGHPSPTPVVQPTPGGSPSVDPTTTTPATPTDTLWLSDDGPILGLATHGDRVFAVTQSKLVSIPRAGGKATLLASSPGGFAYRGSIAVNDEAIYWGTGGETSIGVISRIPIDGGYVLPIASEGYVAMGIALDDTNVYWLSNDAVLSVPLGGMQEPKVLAKLSGLDYEVDFALAGGELYWSTNDSAVDSSDLAQVLRVKTDGSGLEVIGAGPVFSLEPDGRGGVAWLEDPAAVAVRTDGAAVTRTPLGGWVDEIATDGARWFWRDERTGVLSVISEGDAAPRAFTDPVQYATANNGNGHHTIVDAKGIVWADRRGPIAYQPEVNVVRAQPLPQ